MPSFNLIPFIIQIEKKKRLGIKHTPCSARGQLGESVFHRWRSSQFRSAFSISFKVQTKIAGAF